MLMLGVDRTDGIGLPVGIVVVVADLGEAGGPVYRRP